MTPKQAKMIHFIYSFIKEQGHSPSYREMSKHLGYKTISNISSLLFSLKRGGYIELRPNTPRSVFLTEKGERYVRYRVK